jgi:hypothetical protein
MSAGVGLSSGADFLRDAALAYLLDQFVRPPVSVSAEIAPGIKWKPAIQLKLNHHLTLVAEVSETPYPSIFRLRRTDILTLQTPISIYCVCPHEAYLTRQDEVKELQAHGYGLYTVEADGAVTERFRSIPIIQQIGAAEFKEEIKHLPNKIKQRLVASYQIYKTNAPAGVADITEAVETLVLRAAQDSQKKGWLSAADAKPGKIAATLGAMARAPQFQNAVAAIGGAQGYINRYRNTAHHPPKNKTQAYKKYRDCRHGFLEGIKEIVHFHAAVRNIGLSGAL